MDVPSEEPSIGVEQVERSRTANPGRWLFSWRLRNKTAKAMRLLSLRVPHGKFKAEESEFLPPVEIGAENSFVLEVAVTCDEPPKTLIENAFLILLVDWQEIKWRFFVPIADNGYSAGGNLRQRLNRSLSSELVSPVSLTDGGSMTRKEQDLYILTRMRG